LVEKWIDNLGDRAVTSSDENTAEISLIRKDSSVETILDGANLSHFENLPSKEDLKKEFELPQDKLIVSYTGALMFNKGIEFLLNAIPKILVKNKDIFFVVAGFPVEGVTDFVKKNKLEENVRIVSPLEYFELPKLLMASDIGIDPKDSSTRQASGKILQYMAAGIPVVCFDRLNNRTYLEEGGQYVKEISADGLAEGILALAQNKELMKKKGDFNIKQIEKFSWDISAKKIEEIYLK
jgi:glycosyltransferase involved in cell wall biosynthesis